MVCAPVSLRFGPWKLASILVLVLLAGAPGGAASERSVLAFSEPAPTPLAAAAASVTHALPAALASAGYEMTWALPDRAYATMATRDGWLTASEAQAGQWGENQFVLALLAHAEAVLTVKLVANGDQVVLEATLAGVIAQQPAALRASAENAEIPRRWGSRWRRAGRPVHALGVGLAPHRSGGPAPGRRGSRCGRTRGLASRSWARGRVGIGSG